VQDMLQQVLISLDPQTVLLVSGILAVVTVVALAGWGRHYRHLRAAREDISHLQAVASKGREILAAAPDGLFLWDHVLGGITVSRRLSVLLNLEAGLYARYDDIRERFDGDSLKALERGCSALRGNGTPFDLLLRSGDRTIQAIGQRAETSAGQAVADLVWMRDITEIVVAGQSEMIAASSVEDTRIDDRHLTALLDAMQIPVWLRDAKLERVFSNVVAAHRTEPPAALAVRAQQTGVAAFERQLTDVDGVATLMEVVEIPLDAVGGGFLGYAIPVTGGALAVDVPVLSPQSIEPVFDELPTAVALFASDTRLEYVNAAYCRLWGLDQRWLQSRPDMNELLEKLRQNRSLPEVENFRDFKKQEIARFQSLNEPASTMMHLPDGRSIRHRIVPCGDGGLAHLFEDWSEHLDLRRSNKELGAVQVETLENLQEGVAVFGSDGRLKLFNPVYCRLWTLPEADLLDRPHLTEVLEKSRRLFPLPEDQVDWADDDWDRHKSGVAARMLSRTRSAGQVHMRNGNVVEYANIPLPDGAVLLSYIDITDSARVEQALRDQGQALEDANRMKSEFIADVAREIRTPLNTVIGFADMLDQEYFGQLNPRQGEYARGISGTSRNLMNVVAEILDLAAMDAGQMNLDLQGVEVHGLLVSALQLVKDRARRKNIKLAFECPPDIGWVVGDSERLRQVVYKLLSNAVSFTPAHGNISLSGVRTRSHIEVTVRDSGIGIPAADKQRIFEPFDKGSAGAPANAADTDVSDRGTGLGLTIVKRFVEHHGGQVEVRSQLGRGTTVICRLPVQHRAAAATDAVPTISPDA